MTNEQAIEYLSESTVEHKIDDSFAEMHNEAISLAIQALEKQVPKKPILNKAPLPPYHCLNGCGLHEDRIGENHCFYCGQKLDWGDEND